MFFLLRQLKIHPDWKIVRKSLNNATGLAALIANQRLVLRANGPTHTSDGRRPSIWMWAKTMTSHTYRKGLKARPIRMLCSVLPTRMSQAFSPSCILPLNQ